jgi:hypothetical protein
MRRNLKRLIWIAPVAIVGMALFVLLGGEIVKQLWNWLLPPLFGWPQLTFWQALAMLALCRILFGGLGIHGRAGSNMRQRWDQRWQVMTPEEREQFRQRIRRHWGMDPVPPGSGSEGA